MQKDCYITIIDGYRTRKNAYNYSVWILNKIVITISYTIEEKEQERNQKSNK